MTQLVVMAMDGEEGDSSFLLYILYYSIKGKPELMDKAVSSFTKRNTKFYQSSFMLWLKSRHVTLVDCLFCLKQVSTSAFLCLDGCMCILLLPLKFSVRTKLMSLYVSAKVRTRCHHCEDTPKLCRAVRRCCQVALPAFPVMLHLHTLKGGELKRKLIPK